jgi:hypothetical protein
LRCDNVTSAIDPARTEFLRTTAHSGLGLDGGLSGGVKVKSSQKIFTDTEITSLTGICPEHLHNLARTRHIGFIVRAAAAAGEQADQWLFTLSDLIVLVRLSPRCEH